MSNHDWDWRRITGVLGVLFFVVFAIALLGFWFRGPEANAPISEIREFVADDGSILHTGNWIGGIAFVFLFLPFAAGLRSVLSENDVDAGMWTRTGFGAAVGIIVIAGVGSVFVAAGVLAYDSSTGDDVLRFAAYADAYLITVILAFGAGLFLAANSIVVLRTGVLWRWLGWFGLVTAVLSVIVGLWPLDGDPAGALATLGWLVFPLLAIWSLLVGANLLRMPQRESG